MFRLIGLLALALLVLPSSGRSETLQFCYDPYPPYTLGSEGTPTGGSKVELLEAVIARIDGLSATVTIMPWKRCQADAKAGQMDGILPLFLNEERASYLAFSIGTSVEESVLWHRTDQFPQDYRWNGDFNDISHLRLGMLNGAYIDQGMQDVFENGKGITRARDTSTLMELLIKDRVDLVAMDSAVGNYVISSSGWQNMVRRLEKPIVSRKAHFGLSKASGADQYLDEFDRVIAELGNEGIIDQIFGGP